jgi:hypothetical protein
MGENPLVPFDDLAHHRAQCRGHQRNSTLLPSNLLACRFPSRLVGRVGRSNSVILLFGGSYPFDNRRLAVVVELLAKPSKATLDCLRDQ